MTHIKTAIRTVVGTALTVVGLTTGSVAAAPACRAPAFETIQPEQSAAAGTPVGVSILMRIALPGKIERIGFLPESLIAHLGGGEDLLLSFDDASMYRRHNGLKGKAGPLIEAMLNGSTAAGCEVLEGFKLDQQDYRVKFTRGTLTVYAYGTGTTHNFFVIHKRRPDTFVRGLAQNFERQVFIDLLSTIQPPKQE